MLLVRNSVWPGEFLASIIEQDLHFTLTPVRVSQTSHITYSILLKKHEAQFGFLVSACFRKKEKGKH